MLTLRTLVCDQILAEYDFGEDDVVVQAYAWEHDGDESTCLLSMEGIDGPYNRGFIVRFAPNSDTVLEAYPGDPH